MYYKHFNIDSNRQKFMSILHDAYYLKLFEEYNGNESWSTLRSAYLYSIKNKDTRLVDIFIAYNEINEPIGILTMEHSPCLNMINIYILPDYRRRGIGKKLISNCSSSLSIDFEDMHGYYFSHESRGFYSFFDIRSLDLDFKSNVSDYS